jgi:mono/diheme cytochrome c family protein
MSATRRSQLLGLAAVAVAVPLLLTPLVSARPSATSITVTITDSAIKLSKKTAPAGTVNFTVKNAGKAKHNFKIGAKKTPVLAPGKSAKLTVNFTKAGNVSYTSTVAGDAKKGLKGVFIVKAAPSTGGNVAAGKTVFVSTGCGACHVFKAANGTGTIGPNLDTAPLTKSLILNRVTNGKGAMPSYAGQLTSQQMQDVADFLLASKG